MCKIDYSHSKSIKRNLKIIAQRPLLAEISSREIKNGIILPYRRKKGMTYGLGGVVDADGEFVKESAFWLAINHTKSPDWGGAYSFSKNEMNFLDETVIFAGFINNNEWGHFLTDWSVRLWYAAREDLTSRVVFCQRDNDKIHINIRKMLEYAGIGEERLIFLHSSDAPLRCSKVIIPDMSMGPWGYTKEYRYFFERIAKKVVALSTALPKYDKIYLTRTGLRPNKDIGEEEIENFYRRCGYEILRPEQMSFEEQVCACFACGEMVSLEGSGAHNILFSKPGLKQTILEKTQAVNERQIIINQCCDTDVTYVGTYPKVKFYDYYSDGPFLVGITKDFQRYARARGFAEQPRRKISVWLKNYTKYLTIRPYRRVKSIIEKGKRHFGFSSRTA